MDDLIRRSDVLNVIEHTGNSMSGWLWEELHEDIQTLPAVDAVEVRHSCWTRVDYDPVGHDYICSACQNKNDRASAWCPDCGARMDGRREEVSHERPFY